MARKRKRAFFVFQIGLLVMLAVTVGWWVCSYVRICGFETPLGHDSAFRIWSCYGIVTAGKYKDSSETPRLQVYLEDPSIYDQGVMTVRSVGIKMKTLRERPSFKWESRSFEFRGRRWSRTIVSFPHWLLASLFAAPSLLCLFVRLFRGRINRRCSGVPPENSGQDEK